MTKTAVLKTALSASGITRLRWRSLSAQQLYCFNYHRIGDPNHTEFDRGVFSCTQERFAEHVELIGKRFEIASIEKLVHVLDHGHTGTKPLALITFDDGYLDNYALAFPVLKAAGATGVFFLPTDFIGTDRIPWWDEIAWMIRHSKRSTLALVGLSDPLTCDEPEQAINAVLRLVKSRSYLRMSAQLEEIRTACGLNGENGQSRQRLFMNWDEAIEMRRAGMDIGSHTHSHELLSHLCPQRQDEEMRESKTILESRLGGPVHSIAYPVGTREAFTHETCEIARRVGYRVGFSFIGHANPLPLKDPMCIGRLAVEDNVKASDLMALTCFPKQFS